MTPDPTVTAVSDAQLDELISWLNAKWRRHGELEDLEAANALREYQRARSALADVGECKQCVACLTGKTDETGMPITATRMIACALCGNKRCPHATDHRYACTNSNEPNQQPRPAAHTAQVSEALKAGVMCLEAEALRHRHPEFSKGATKGDIKDGERGGRKASEDKLRHAAVLRRLAEQGSGAKEGA